MIKFKINTKLFSLAEIKELCPELSAFCISRIYSKDSIDGEIIDGYIHFIFLSKIKKIPKGLCIINPQSEEKKVNSGEEIKSGDLFSLIDGVRDDNLHDIGLYGDVISFLRAGKIVARSNDINNKVYFYYPDENMDYFILKKFVKKVAKSHPRTKIFK